MRSGLVELMPHIMNRTCSVCICYEVQIRMGKPGVDLIGSYIDKQLSNRLWIRASHPCLTLTAILLCFKAAHPLASLQTRPHFHRLPQRKDMDGSHVSLQANHSTTLSGTIVK